MHTDPEMETAAQVREPLLTIRDLTAILQLSETAVRKLVDSEHGPTTYRVGGSIRVYRTDLDDWIRSGRAANARVHSSTASPVGASN